MYKQLRSTGDQEKQQATRRKSGGPVNRREREWYNTYLKGQVALVAITGTTRLVPYL